jgi:integrase
VNTEKRSKRPRERLTAEIVKAIPVPAKGSIYVYDCGVRGFTVRVFAPTDKHPEGARVFTFIYYFDGAERRRRIGDFFTWTVTQARKQATEWRKRVDAGEDPFAEERARRGAPTIKDLAARYEAEHLPTIAADKDPVRRKDELRLVQIIVDELKPTTLAVDVDDVAISAMHKRVTKSRGPVRANRVLYCASIMFGLALKRKEDETAPWRNQKLGNPCRGVKKNPEIGKERFLSLKEFTALEHELDARPGDATDCIRIIEYTGCRPCEALGSTFEQFDLPALTWTKKASSTKQRRLHHVPVVPEVAKIIARRAEVLKSGPVFPGLSERSVRYAFRTAANAAGLKDVRVYDLRHSFASIGVGKNWSLYTVGKTLGHSAARTTQRYAHLADDPLREAVNSIGSTISAATSGKSRGEVVAGPRKRGSST